MKKVILIHILLVTAILSACSSESEKLEKLEAGNGVYVNTGDESDVFQHLKSGYKRSDECESNEFFIKSMNTCVVAIDVDMQIANGLIVHREFIKEVEGRTFYRLLVSSPDGSLLKRE